MLGVSNFQMTVFNRWGQLLFETSNPEVGWDGYFKGQPQDPGGYVYIGHYRTRGANGANQLKKGTFLLIR